MKIIIYISLCLLLSFSAYSQNIGIGITNPDSSAILDITSLDKGILLPRLDSTSRKNIINPKDGLILYDSTTYSFWFFRDTIWTEFHWEPGDNLGNHIATQNLDLGNMKINNLDSPSVPLDATNKAYVDTQDGLLLGQINNNKTDIINNTGYIDNVLDAVDDNTFDINSHISNDTDLSPTNELQMLSISGNDLTLSTGNTITLPSNTGVFENDAGLVRNTGSTSNDFIFGDIELPQNGVNTTDTMFFFDKSKASFRFGTLDNSSKWSPDSIGLSSFAFGLNPLAIGDGAISLGYLTQSRGTLSFAQGSGTIANAIHSISMGYQSQALGNSAIALGNSNIAKGNESFVAGLYSEANGASSTAIGNFAISDAYRSMAIGCFNEGGGDSSNWVLTDPIFEVGIGLDALNKKNALTIQKNGKISFKNYSFPNPDGTTDQILKTDGSGNLTWIDQTPVVFENNSGVVRNTGPNTDDFVFGAMGLPQNGNPATGTLFFFDESKGAFRAGALDNSQKWCPDSIGDFSAAFGFNTTAYGHNSFATGKDSEATEIGSIAMGDNASSSGNYSIAIGIQTKATGNFTTAIGHTTEASSMFASAFGHSTKAMGSYSTAMGSTTEASGSYSTAMGFSTEASAVFSTAMGRSTIASGEYSTAIGHLSEAIGEGSTASGYSSVASGKYSTALGSGSNATGGVSSSLGLATKASGFCSLAIGQHTNAYSANSFAIGKYNIGGGDSINWVPTDPLFEIGIGSSSTNENALTIYKNGVAEFSDSLHTDGNLNVGTGIGAQFYLGKTMMQSGGPTILRMDTNVRPFTDDTYDLGSSGKRWDDIYATNGVIQTSDRRLKKNIATLPYGLDDVLQLKPVNYHWNKETYSDKKHLGLIAQELLELIPEAVNQPDNEDEYLGVKYAELVPVLIKAIQEQNELINSQVNTIHSQSTTIESIQNDMTELKQLVSQLIEKSE